MKKNSVIAVGISGGLDSTMTALILKDKGYKVIGLTMKICDDGKDIQESKTGCYGQGEDDRINEAKRTAESLGIPHHVIDLSKEFRREVLAYFKNEYLAGRTPNPCIVCNAKMKFGLLLEMAHKSGVYFDCFATGHYARISKDRKTGRFFLRQGIDKNKDQSYFLHRLSQEQLGKILFPLGSLRKDDIREMATKRGFVRHANKEESQNFCDNYSALLPKGKPGNITDSEGRIIGRHEGIANYTVGQRKLNIGGLKEPYYVIRIEVEANNVIVGPKNLAYSDTAKVVDMNWIIPWDNVDPNNIKAKIRYGSKSTKVFIEKSSDEMVKVRFKLPQFAITPGQSMVFYQKDKVIGGGIIY